MKIVTLTPDEEQVIAKLRRDALKAKEAALGGDAVRAAGTSAAACSAWVRGKAALVELERRGLARHDSGHHHRDADLCFCKAGEVAGLPKLTHWYDVERKAAKP